MPPKKSVFRQPGAKHFQLVHRSQRDPLIHDPEASQHVLKSVERGNLRKACGKSRADLEVWLDPSDVEHDQKKNVGEAALYGIYYDDTDYDYMQHLRTVGVQEDGVDSILIEAPTPKGSKDKAKSQNLFIPKEVLPSASELPRNYESQQAIPQSIAGLQPDMDPHLRQVLEALEDDAFVDDNLSENFFDELVEDGERGSDEDVQFEFEEHGIEDEINDNPGQCRENENEPEEVNWEKKFALFKKIRATHSQESTSDDEFAFEENDTIASLPSISVIGGKGKRRRIGSDASGYSMSSSSMYRNPALQTLDERFDQVMGKQYYEEDEESSPSDEDDEAPELITSREDFSTMVDEFLHDYEILGRKMKLKLEGKSGAEKLETLRRALGQNHVYAHKYDDAQDSEDIETDEKGDRWDCETILTTYSNLENHPRIIRVTPSKPVSKILLDPRTGFPLTREMTNPTTLKTFVTKMETDNQSDEESQGAAHKRNTISRPRNESKEDKRTRKSAVKAEKQARRVEKKAMKEQFDAELKHQKENLMTSMQRTRKL